MSNINDTVARITGHLILDEVTLLDPDTAMLCRPNRVSILPVRNKNKSNLFRTILNPDKGEVER